MSLQGMLCTRRRLLSQQSTYHEDKWCRRQMTCQRQPLSTSQQDSLYKLLQSRQTTSQQGS